MRKNQSIIVVIPDRVFFDLWEMATKISLSDYIHLFLSDSRLKKCTGKQTFKLLNNIYEAANYTPNEILKKSGKSKAYFKNRFCVKKSTLDSWFNGTNKCPDYVRLMFVREFRLLDLGPHIYLESEYVPQPKRKTKVEEKSSEPYVFSKESFKSLKEYEQTHVHYGNDPVKDILAKTEYLKKLMKE